MSGSKILKILLAVAIFATIGATAVSAYATADSFRNPLDSYISTENRFGQYLWSSLYHAGEDLQAVPKTPVYPIAKGIVTVSKTGVTDYGQLLAIEHTLPDGSKMESFYGHLSKRDGYKMVVAGTEITDLTKPIGYIGYSDENGGYGPHLHYGIVKGGYDKTWRYWGRVSLSELSKYYKPSDYLNLIRAVNTPEVYRLANLGSKVWVSSSNTFNSCGWRWDDIRPVSVAERNSHSTSFGSPCFAAGTFIKRANNPDISLIKGYLDGSGTIQNRLRQRFTNWDAFIRAGGKADLSNVRIVSDVEYNLHTQGKDLTYNANS